ncbi:MAG: FAD-dependent oxidoreductase [Methylovulum sp.]|uniref:protoporphyrinogen/coproporphyrinogen oxidase n=1 Tax=Methylovulum sp. TaxID=1916980 RepID=UPI002631885F|nr:FAD-dependent oxidoreductase [Methylovulum sp.]MDD2723670.1 FAD-dependent oxidoreductase [Methylovulum sp.]MDD5125432.1 FAD-dependent oxidoreductase [Methylovulum sp.]
MSKVILVGLGVSGLACAMELQQQGIVFTAFEKELVPGGLTRSERMDGFTFDYGPHVILDTPKLFDRLSLDLEGCACQSTIFLETSKVLNIPAPIQHHLHHLTLKQKIQIFSDILHRNATRSPPKPNNFQEHILSQSGKTLFELFFQGYETKRMRFPLTGIDGSMPNRIQPPALAQLFGVSKVTTQSACGGHDARFKYPHAGGIDNLPKAMMATLPNDQLHFGQVLSAIDLEKKQVTFANHHQAFFEHLVLSLPLPEIILLIKNVPTAITEAAEQLVYSSLYILNLGIDQPLSPAWAIGRIPRQDTDFYRVSIPTHYSKACAPCGSDSLTVEVAHHEQRYPLSGQEVRQRIYAGLKRLGILGSQDPVAVEWLHNVRYGHIIYNHKTRAALELIFAYLNKNGVYGCGKYGEWRDMLMSHSMQSGIDTAQRVISATAAEQ